MRKTFKIVLSLVTLGSLTTSAFAINLMQVYQQALNSDPTFKAAQAQEMIEVEAMPQSRALLLPQLVLEGTGGLERTNTKNSLGSTTTKERTLAYDLDLKQSIFNFSNWAQLGSATASVKTANATYNAAAQDLMNRTVQAYFNVLQAKEILRYTEAEKRAIYQEYQRADQSFKVGLKTITDVYNARAAYDNVVASYVVAKNNLDNKRENLRAITNQSYQRFAMLKPFQPHSPNPINIQKWVAQAMTKNWKLVAARYNTIAAHRGILEAEGGHLPTVGLEAKYGNTYGREFGQGWERDKTISGDINVSVPIFSGGATVSAAREARAKYELASQEQEKTYRDVINATRQSYLGVMSSISKLKADKQAVISNRSALRGTQEGYKVGTRTMVDVLNAQETLYASQKEYAVDRYQYIFNSIALKEAAGTLGIKDLQAINGWLINETTVKTQHAVSKKIAKQSSVRTRHVVKSPAATGRSASKMVKKPSTAAKAQSSVVQIGAYSSKANANRAMKRAKKVVKARVGMTSKYVQSTKFYLVHVFITNTKQIQQLKNAGFSKAFVMSK